MTNQSVPLGDIASRLRNGSTDLEQYVERIRERVESVDPELRALVPECDRWGRVRRDVRDLLDRFPAPADRPPLFGVPIGVKDVFHVDRLRTRAGCDLPPSALAGREATSVTTLCDAGAFVLGKTVTTELAIGTSGPTRNPHDLDHTPGGSSSGSAAAVKAGLCPLALGTQTGGSTIRPAAYCGVVGYKPSFGRIPTDGVVELSESADHVGVITTGVAGARLAASILCPGWRPGETDRDRPVLGIPGEDFLSMASEMVVTQFESWTTHLEAIGYEMRRVPPFADLEAVLQRHETLVEAETALAHDQWYPAHQNRYSKEMEAFIQAGRETTVGALAGARTGKREARDEVESAMAEHGVDVWLTPAATGTAPRGLDDTGDPSMNIPWTHAGLPAVTIPVGSGSNGLPLGLQCVGASGADEYLLAWTDRLSSALV